MSTVSGKPQDQLRKLIGERLAEERDRSGFNQQQMAELVGVSRRAYAGWETGEASPGADDLARCDEHGLDVLYVVCGRRGGALRAEETTLINLYKKAAQPGQAALIQTAAALAQGLPPSKEKSKVVQTFHGNVGQSVTGDLSGPVNIDMGQPRRRKAPG